MTGGAQAMRDAGRGGSSGGSKGDSSKGSDDSNCNPMVRFSGMNVSPSAKCGKCPSCRAEKVQVKKS